ncbi:MAG: glycoside hydrolase family 3 C-terminal domain-containing protein [Clostridiales bacterium]|jgi:beta-glucosidase|nr:glycoside hydrolase family 3 C-terminal domain-containing protein [Clostridiales bacterium]
MVINMENHRENYREKARELVSQMTLEEKVSQMVYTSAAVERLGIPAYNWWNEALHGIARSGVATVFPQAIALAATFDAEMLQTVADVISTEGRAKFHEYQRADDRAIYKGLTFWSPNINIFRDPRWGRGHETYGEDPYLTGLLGAAFIRGLQGADREHLKAAACAKHFAVHSGPEDERHSFDAIVDDYDLWNTYLPAFEIAVRDAGVEAVMGAYNRTLGEPCCGSKLLLRDILREKWSFDGHVTSDCWAIKDFHEFHHVTSSPAESVALAVKNGCDVNCGEMFLYAEAAVKDGLLSEAEIDRAVERLLVSRMRLGLLGAPEVPAYTSIPYEKVDCAEHRALNLDVSRRCLVLLKNDGALPLDPAKLKTIGVIGPNADSRVALEGNYVGTPSEYITVLGGVKALAEAAGARVLYAQGCHLYKNSVADGRQLDDRLSEALTVTRHSDAVILCMGLDSTIEGEEGDASNEYAAGDKHSLDLPGRQQHVLEQVVAAANGKPVILVLISGSALAVSWADEHVNGILQAFYPGALGGQAIAEAILGKFSPEGKLPVTFYRSTGDLPDFREYAMKNRTYRYFTGEALYPFGFGLSYSTFALSDLAADAEGGACSLTVTNTGKTAARQTVQVYVETPGQRELRVLAGVGKVWLAPGESKAVRIALGKTAFARYDKDGVLTSIPGKHVLYAGLSQPDPRSVALCGTAPLRAELTLR